MNKIFYDIIACLKDWRNWLSHGLMGIGLLILALWVPVALWIKLIFIACLILLNLRRMRLASNGKNLAQIKKLLPTRQTIRLESIFRDK